MKIGMLQLNFTVGDCRGNTDKIIQSYGEAVNKGSEIVVASELCIFGYPPKDLLLQKNYLDEQDRNLDRLQNYIGEVPLVLGIVERNRGSGKPLYNSINVIQNENVVFRQNKYLLPSYDVFDETRYFEPNIDSIRTYNYIGRKIGFLMCEDIWGGDEADPKYGNYRLDPVGMLARSEPSIIIVLNASPYYWGKGDKRQEIAKKVIERCQGTRTMVYVNQIGGNDDLIFDGRSFAIDSCHSVIGSAKPFEEDLVLLDEESDTRIELLSDTGYEDLENTLVLGIRDYLLKTGKKKTFVSLSGGIDSAVTVYLAVKAVGPENVEAATMPSVFSSQESIEDSLRLASNLGILSPVIPIMGIYDEFGKTIGPIIGWDDEPDNWGEDVTQENIQARIRGMIGMAFSNRRRSIVLSTGNKSEVAVGYCTLYGDMSGGLAVLSDVYKTEVFGIANFINRNQEIIPWNIIKKVPSAELRPRQADSDSLPPYPVLDKILRFYIEEGKSPREIMGMGFDSKTVRWTLDRVDRNEFKRRQAPLGLKVTSKAFGSGRRWPIAFE